MQKQTFYGKYRGVVTSNKDPLGMARIRATVPDVLGTDESGWALPSAPFAGNKMGFVALPIVGSRVWIEFEQGDPDYPIWSGCWWGSKDEMPDEASSAPDGRVLIKTQGGQILILDDPAPNAITIQTSGGQKIVLNDQSITIDFGNGVTVELSTAKIALNDGAGATVELDGPKVAVNDDALEVI